MGSCFLHITKEQPAYEWDYDQLYELSIKQGYGSALDHMWRCLPKHVRAKYPMLGKVGYQSGYYQDEDLILTSQEVKALKAEFEKLLNVLSYKDFETGLNAEQFKKHLESGHYGFGETYFETERQETFDLLECAEEENGWIMIKR